MKISQCSCLYSWDLDKDLKPESSECECRGSALQQYPGCAHLIQSAITTSTFLVCPVDTNSFGEIRTTLIGAQTDRSVPVSWVVQLIVDFRNIQFSVSTNKTFSYEQWQTPFPPSSPYKWHPIFVLPLFFAAISTKSHFNILCSLYRDNLVLPQDCRIESPHLIRLCDCGYW